MDRDLSRLVSNLNDAISEAIATSEAVQRATEELNQAGYDDILFDIAIRTGSEEQESPDDLSSVSTASYCEFVFTADDEVFLKELKIAA